jgi:hypothetical protein
MYKIPGYSVCLYLLVPLDLVVDDLDDAVGVLLEAVERVLDGLLDRPLDDLAHIFDLVHTSGLLLLQGGDEDGEHLEAGLVEAWAFAQLLHDLHEHLLAVGVAARLVRLRQEEVDLVAMVLVQLLDNVECALTQCLTDRVEVDEDEVGNVAEPQDGVVHVEWVLHVAVDEARRIDERDQVEVLLLAGCDLCVDIVQAAVNLRQCFQLWIQVHCGVAKQRLALFATRHKSEALGLDGHARALNLNTKSDRY